jgi:hypothetical protein
LPHTVPRNAGFWPRPALGAVAAGAPASDLALLGAISGLYRYVDLDQPRAYRKVERKDKLERVADLLSLAFRWARSVDPSQPLTSGVWDGEWGDPQRRSEIANIQLDNSDVVTFHCYDEPAAFGARIAELSPLGRPILCTEYLARTLGSTVDGVCQLRSGTTLVRSIGVWSLRRPRPTFHGTPGITRTRQLRSSGFKTWSNPMDGPTGTPKLK